VLRDEVSCSMKLYKLPYFTLHYITWIGDHQGRPGAVKRRCGLNMWPTVYKKPLLGWHGRKLNQIGSNLKRRVYIKIVQLVGSQGWQMSKLQLDWPTVRPILHIADHCRWSVSVEFLNFSLDWPFMQTFLSCLYLILAINREMTIQNLKQKENIRLYQNETRILRI